jgi:hypothetical protein
VFLSPFPAVFLIVMNIPLTLLWQLKHSESALKTRKVNRAGGSYDPFPYHVLEMMDNEGRQMGNLSLFCHYLSRKRRKL